MATKRWAFEFLAKGQYQRTAPFTKNPILTTSSQLFLFKHGVSKEKGKAVLSLKRTLIIN